MQLENQDVSESKGIVELFGVLLSSNKVYGNDPQEGKKVLWRLLVLFFGGWSFNSFLKMHQYFPDKYYTNYTIQYYTIYYAIYNTIQYTIQHYTNSSFIQGPICSFDGFFLDLLLPCRNVPSHSFYLKKDLSSALCMPETVHLRNATQAVPGFKNSHLMMPALLSRFLLGSLQP